MWRLTIEDDEGQRTSLDLTQDEYTVGRGEDVDIRLTERNVSRHHATLRHNAEGWELVDESSYNGTFVNGERVAGDGAVLKARDNVQIGDYRLEIAETTGERVADEQRARRPDRLVVVIGPVPGAEYSLEGDRLAIGRAEEAAVSINHASVSRMHAELVNLGSGRWEVIDLGSSNGIRINGMELRRGIIEPGDAFELGDVRLRFVAAGKFFRPSTGLSEPLAGMMPFEGMTAAASPAAASSSRIGMIVAVIAVVIITGGALAYTMVGGKTDNGPAPAAAPTADAESKKIVDKAMALAKGGQVDEAHTLLRTVPEESAVRDGDDFRTVEDLWADTMFKRFEESADDEEKKAILNDIADATSVSREKRQHAIEELAKLGFTRKIDDPPPRQGPPRYQPPPGGEGPPRPLPPPPPETTASAKTPAKNDFDPSSNKNALIAKMRSGRASEAELRMLRGLCTADGDTACRNEAQAKLMALKNKDQ
jgi:pSer/pThr/pTyr-binding forkhead associated (FHA) protein